MALKRKVYLRLHQIGNFKKIPVPISVTAAIILTLLCILYCTKFWSVDRESFLFLNEDFLEDEEFYRGYLIKNNACKIPDMDFFDKSVFRLFRKAHRPSCGGGKPPLFESNRTSIFLLNSSLVHYNVSTEYLICCYRPFYRVPPRKRQIDNRVQYSNSCRFFDVKTGETISDEFIDVLCIHRNKLLYRDYFAFVPLKDEVKKLKVSLQDRTSSPLNVLVIGLDSVSRINLHRQLWITSGYLRNVLLAVEFLGFNKVGDNTFPNLIPALTGLSIKGLRRVCWKENGRFDNCPFVWKKFKSGGYVTAFGEDASWLGVFHYLKYGFLKQPVDYMYNVFNRQAELVTGGHRRPNVAHCIGSREVYKTFLEYIKKFIYTMDEAKHNYFAFFWGSSLTHDDPNAPMLGDVDYYNFFRDLKESGHLENTALVFMSDHGMRWGLIRQTYQGSIEDRLPFLYLLLPKWFKVENQPAYKNLRKNVRRLITTFDLHQTFLDFLNPAEINSRISNTSIMRRSYSLFEEIPELRSCRDAGIVSHWCACQQSYKCDGNSSIVRNAAKAIIHHMNSQLKDYKQCVQLRLRTIVEARKIIKFNMRDYKDYIVKIQAEPGSGIFESTVRLNYVKNNIHHMKIIGSISRLNLYKEESFCINNFQLRLYCYCKILLSRPYVNSTISFLTT